MWTVLGSIKSTASGDRIVYDNAPELPVTTALAASRAMAAIMLLGDLPILLCAALLHEPFLAHKEARRGLMEISAHRGILVEVL